MNLLTLTVFILLIASTLAATLWAALLRGELRRLDAETAASARMPRGPMRQGPCPDCGLGVYLTRGNRPNRRYHPETECVAEQELQARLRTEQEVA